MTGTLTTGGGFMTTMACRHTGFSKKIMGGGQSRLRLYVAFGLPQWPSWPTNVVRYQFVAIIELLPCSYRRIDDRY